jgi:hypothetical protein
MSPAGLSLRSMLPTWARSAWHRAMAARQLRISELAEESTSRSNIYSARKPSRTSCRAEYKDNSLGHSLRAKMVCWWPARTMHD